MAFHCGMKDRDHRLKIPTTTPKKKYTETPGGSKQFILKIDRMTNILSQQERQHKTHTHEASE